MSDLDGFVYQPPQGPLEILYSDRDIVVVDKPSGLLSVPGKLDMDSLLTRLERIFSTVYAIHRLDMDTSGVMVFALRRKAERALKLQFQQRKVSKVYEAIVDGRIAETQGIINQPIRPSESPLRNEIHPTGKEAITSYEVLHRDEDWSHVRLHPKTGRSHQLRVHLQWLGHPILGDRFYEADRVAHRASRLMLHAHSLSFLHPYSQKEMCFEVDWEPVRDLL